MGNEKRSSFTGKIGFVLAAAGSAVGLGNIWRFPYLAAKYGGGMFLLVYLILAVTFGFALMVAEIAIGRKTGLSAIGAFKSLDKRFSFVGWIASIVPMIILPYYCVIGGWVAKYLAVFLRGNSEVSKAAVNIDGGYSYFNNFIASASGEPFWWFLIYVALTAIVVFFGVDKGVEKFSKILMPILVLLSICIAVYSVTLPGAMDGVVYYLKPDFSHFSIKTVLAAMGQLFYSMSLAMGIMITYGSYMKKDVSLEASVSQIEIFDTGIAFLAGLMIIPAAFAGGAENIGKGPGLMFMTLPKVFYEMNGGIIVGIAFFVLVLFAALTSSISLMETVVSIINDKTGIGRKASCVIVILGTIILGMFSSLGYGVWGNVKIIGMQFLDFFDFISNSVIMPIVAFFTCVFVGYYIKPETVIDEVEINNSKFKRKALFVGVIKYVAPVFIVLILITSVMDAFGLFGFKF